MKISVGKGVIEVNLVPQVVVHCSVSRRLNVVIASLSLLVCVTATAGEWPEFRGPWRNGLVTAPGDKTPVGLPTHWSETENVRWKTEMPFQGWSTPVVMNGRVWLTTATTDGHDFYVIGVDAETGEIRINEKVFHSDNPEPLGNEINCYASPSPAIEPGRVYVHFGSYGTACLDTNDGKVLWQRTDLPCRHYRGPGSSVVLFENLLILTFDGVDVQYLTAIDKKTGETIWRTDRTTDWQDLDENGKIQREGDFRKSFTTPTVIDVGGKPQVVSSGSRATYGYDAISGKELWKIHNVLAFTPSVSPVSSCGLVFFATGQGTPELWAVRPDGQGDVTDTHVAWKLNGRSVPEQPSPTPVGDLLYLVSNDGLATCLEAATGNQVWAERLGGNYMASPIYADGQLFFFSTQGKATVLKEGRVYEVVATNKLDVGCMASPAVAGKAIFLRTKTHLYRLETKE